MGDTQPGEPGPGSGRGSQITMWTGALAGVAALIGGAVLTGYGHYTATGKALKEEGLDPKIRLKAVPVAARALAITSLVSVTVAGAALWTMQQTLQPRDVTEVATLADALAAVRQQRAMVQAEFAKRMQREESTPPQDAHQTDAALETR
mmetsp:Transcript_15108/g.45618  ORF Transcript_15108/g.45618 Transcript_15108/m.45618 type:complete len:149 (-) Transcript_15108:487-933(-)